MSTPHLRAQLEPLEASARRLVALQANELDPALRDLAALNRRLDEAWSGQARDAFDGAFAGTLSRLATAGSDLRRAEAYLHTVTDDYRELDEALIATIGERDRPHDHVATRSSPGGGYGFGGGLSAAAGGGSIVRAALTGNPFEDLWLWIMSWFGVGSSPTPTATPSASDGFQPSNNGFAGWSTPQPTAPAWAYPVMCTNAASTDPSHPQPFINNATCNALVSQLDPIDAAQLHQQIQRGEVALEIMTIGGMVTLVAHDLATGAREPIAATVEQGDNDEGSGSSGSSGPGGGGGPGQRPDPSRVVETIEEQIQRVGQARFDELALDPANRQVRAQEAQVILDLEQRDIVSGPVRRSPFGYGGDFFDATGQEWDVKQFNSFAPRKNGGFDLETSVKAVADEIIDRKENIVIDTRNMTTEHIDQLWDRLVDLGLNDRVIWWP